MDSLHQKKFLNIIAKVMRRIMPDRNVIVDVDSAVLKINSSIKLLGIDAECVKGGSIAKNTFLKDDHDVDLFVRFSLNYPDEKISDILSQLLLCAFPKIKLRRVHGSRDYFQFKLKNLDYEIIPVSKIHESALHEARNITDFSPFHVSWVSSKTKARPELSGEIRLAKIFCKANNVYGAESYIKGFSGHIIDILVIYYGSFLNLVKKFSSLEKLSKKSPLIIDPEKHLSNPLKEINESKISPLVIIDPIQKDRNAAAALSEEKINLFINSCKGFINSPSEDFFVVKKFLLKDVHVPSGHQKIVIDINCLDGSKDVVGTKILKVYQFIIERMRTYGFYVENSGWIFDYDALHASIYIVIPKSFIEEYIAHQGPPVSNNVGYQRFCEVHSGEKLTIKNHRVYARIKREYVDGKKYVVSLINDDYIKSRVSSVRVL